MHTKYEKEGVAKAEELEMAKLKMQARLSEADSTAMQLQAKLAQIDKARAKLSSDLEAQAQALAGLADEDGAYKGQITNRPIDRHRQLQLIAEQQHV